MSTKGYWFRLEDQNKRYPPRRRQEPTPPGQSFEELTAKHGRPYGPFDQDRILTYDATAPKSRRP